MAHRGLACGLAGPRLRVAGVEQVSVGGRELVETRMKESAGNERSNRDAIEERARELARGNPAVVMQLALDGEHPLQEFFGILQAAKFRNVAGGFPGTH